MSKPTKVPGISKPPASLAPDVKRYLETLAEAVEIRLGRRGDKRDRAITLRELIDSGLAVDLKSTPSTSYEGLFFNRLRIRHPQTFPLEI